MRKSTARFLAGALAAHAAFALSFDTAAGEPMPTRAERIMAPGRSTAADDSAEALLLNPANLGFLPAWDFRWTGLRCADTAKVGCGHSLDLATPLFGGLATGLRVDYVMPPGGGDYSSFPFNGRDYAWLTWGVGVRASDALAFGASIQRSYSSNTYTDALVGLTGGMTLRPSTHLSLSVVAHDFNGPSTQLLPPRMLPVLDRSYVLAAALRPTGTRVVELGVEAKYLEGSDQWLPRATLGIDVPRVGRARGDVEVAHLPNDARRGVLATAGLEVAFGTATAGGGAVFGNGLGHPNDLGLYATLSISGDRKPGVLAADRAVLLRIEKTPGNRNHAQLLRRLWKLADTRDVAAVTLALRTEPASSMAHAEELADAIRVLRERGKKVLCSLEDNGARSLYVCAQADRIVVNPAGGLRYAGLRSQYMYFAGLLQKVGVRAEFVRIGAHKTAPEQFANEAPSDVGRADAEELLRQSEAAFVRGVAAGRHLTEQRVREATLRGPFVASEAREAGFVDGTAFDDELERVTSELVGHRVPLVKFEPETLAPSTFGPRGKVAVLYVDGDMMDGRSQRIPLVDMRLVGSYSIAEQARELENDPLVRAVVLRIESPGGSSMAADVMWRALTQLGEKKPLIVSMGSTAASGGYYIACAGKTIYALPLTITGSIGVFYGKADLSELLATIGVHVATYRTTPRADAESLLRPYTDDERRELGRKVEQFYGVFVDRVAAGRKLSRQDVDAVAQGRVWTGEQALAHKLVDRLGGFRQALDAAREAAHLPDDAPIAEYPPAQATLLDRALALAGVSATSPSATIDVLPPQLRGLARALAPFTVYAGDIPLARLEWTSVDDASTSSD